MDVDNLENARLECALQELSARDFKILMFLVSRAGNRPKLPIKVSQREIANRCGVRSENVVRDAIENLVYRHWIIRNGRPAKGRSYEYQLPFAFPQFVPSVIEEESPPTKGVYFSPELQEKIARGFKPKPQVIDRAQVETELHEIAFARWFDHLDAAIGVELRRKYNAVVASRTMYLRYFTETVWQPFLEGMSDIDLEKELDAAKSNRAWAAEDILALREP